MTQFIDLDKVLSVAPHGVVFHTTTKCWMRADAKWTRAGAFPTLRHNYLTPTQALIRLNDNPDDPLWELFRVRKPA